MFHSRLSTVLLCLLLVSAVTGCGIRKKMEDNMKAMGTTVADQQFKTAVALIELHKVRYGSYPETLADLKFMSKTDQSALLMVRYTLLGNGYRLDVLPPLFGEIADTNMSRLYPPEFWQGLGIISSNLRREE